MQLGKLHGHNSRALHWFAISRTLGSSLGQSDARGLYPAAYTFRCSLRLSVINGYTIEPFRSQQHNNNLG